MKNGPATVTAATLRETAVYISPTGRRCKWVPSERGGYTSSVFQFEYMTGHTGFGGTGFTLTAQNLRLMRLEQRR